MIGGRRHVRGAREVALCARVAGATPLIWLAVHALPLPRTLAWLTPRRASPRALAPERVLQLAGRVLDRHPFGIKPTCLLRSLVLYRFLRECGVPACLHLGVVPEGDTLSGHAWLTLQGHPFLEASDPREKFRIVFSYPQG